MHIVFFTDNFPPEGNAIASRVYERACYWVRWGHQVTVITSAPNFPEGKVFRGYKNKWYQVDYIDGIRVVRVKTFIARNKGFVLRTLDFLSYIIPAFFAGLWQDKPDVVVATTPQFFVGITAWLVAFIRRTPFVLEVADIWPASIVGVGAMKKSLLIRWLEKLELFLYHQAVAIVVLTEAFKKNLSARGVTPKKLSVVINGVDQRRYAPLPRDTTLARQLGLPTAQLLVGYLGTHGMAHGLLNVLKTAELLQDTPEIQIVFVGTGAEREMLIAHAKTHQLQNVTFIPPQAKEKMRALWSLFDVALVHLKNDAVFAEVIPSKIFEAMGMGLPILLAAPRGDASDIVMTHEVGIWVPAENPERLKEAMITLYQDKNLRAAYARQSLLTAPRFSRERQARDMLIVLQQHALSATTIERVIPNE